MREVFNARTKNKKLFYAVGIRKQKSVVYIEAREPFEQGNNNAHPLLYALQSLIKSLYGSLKKR